MYLKINEISEAAKKNISDLIASFEIMAAKGLEKAIKWENEQLEKTKQVQQEKSH